MSSIYVNENEDVKRIKYDDLNVIFIQDSNYKGVLYNTNNIQVPLVLAGLFFLLEFSIISYNPLLSLTFDNGLFNAQFENIYDSQGIITQTTRTMQDNPDIDYTFIYKQL